MLVLGSGGRGESLLALDQDNAAIIDDAHDGDLDAPEDWFAQWFAQWAAQWFAQWAAQWAARMNAMLDPAGVPVCKVGEMVWNRMWRKRLSEWRATLDDWARGPGRAGRRPR